MSQNHFLYDFLIVICSLIILVGGFLLGVIGILTAPLVVLSTLFSLLLLGAGFYLGTVKNEK